MAQANGTQGSEEFTIEESVPPFETPPSLEGLGIHMRALMRNQSRLMKMMQMSLNHTLKLQQNVDPLTAKKRAAFILAGACAGGGLVMAVMQGIAFAAAH